KRPLSNEVVNIIGKESTFRPQDMKFCRAEAKAVQQAARNRSFSIFHARSDLGHDHVFVAKSGEAFSHFAERSWQSTGDSTSVRINGRHGDKSDLRIGKESIYRRFGRVDDTNVGEADHHPPFWQVVAHAFS